METCYRFSSQSKFVTTLPAIQSKISSRAAGRDHSCDCLTWQLFEWGFSIHVWDEAGRNWAYTEKREIQAVYKGTLFLWTVIYRSRLVLRAVLQPSSLVIPKPSLSTESHKKAIRNLLGSCTWSCLEQETGLQISCGSFYPEPSCDLMNAFSCPGLALLSKVVDYLPAVINLEEPSFLLKADTKPAECYTHELAALIHWWLPSVVA